MPFTLASVRSFRPRPYHAAAALLFVLLGAVCYWPYLTLLPNGIHAWAQSDRYTLAINFYDYGLDFFTPRTSYLGSIGGVTGVEFPVQAYAAALGGVVFGRSSILPLFRLLDVAMVMLGFYYLFRLVFERTGNFTAALVPAAFLLSSPVFAFYAGTTLPDPFSLSLSFIGYYYWLRFFDSRHFPDLRKALLILGLAALVKTTTAMHLMAVIGITTLWGFAQPDWLKSGQRWRFLALAGAVVAVVVGFYLHNQHLNTVYQSGQFLAEARPITNDDEYHAVLQSLVGLWLPEYATVVQYRVLAVCLVLLLLFLRPNLRQFLPLTLLLLAATALGAIFAKVMGIQFGAHDYYVICSLFPPAVLLLLLAVLNLGRYGGNVRYLTSVGFAVLTFFLVADGYKRLGKRMADDYPPFSPYPHLWMRGGAEEMAQARVPKAAAILMFNESAPNIAPVYFDRRAMVWQPGNVSEVTVNDFLNRMAADSLDYLVMAPDVYAQLAPQHAAMAAELDVVGQKPAMIFRRRNRSWPW
ncbi:glycosyltransferase family 39 protein [Hymenobacter sp. 5317J-9]|uniref:glycosyltransferase family 39 protein n=1 Tax=Hymenobacter sp. 5317J-9 TaxID=2932250 RepID=UPI001FD71139|nr:glycosyltransferase family 39 protein [Hymenobacter sp. 5317J-9]UOQ98180.1 glycosyltransferase family 39 protein [Hymenobacter sp. 5317J-9]